MLGLSEGFVLLAEGLITVRVDAVGALGAEFGGDAGPFVGAVESVMHDDHEVGIRGGSFDGVVAILGEFFNGLECKTVFEARLVDEFKPNDGVGIFKSAVLKGHGFQHVQGLLDIGAFLPVHFSSAARVLEAILGTRNAMEINPDFQPRRFRPANGFFKICICTFQIWGFRVVVRPEADGDTESRRNQKKCAQREDRY